MLLRLAIASAIALALILTAALVWLYACELIPFVPLDVCLMMPFARIFP